MYKIRHRIIKPVLITEEGGEKACMLSFDRYGCVYTQRHTRAKRQKHACHVPAGIKLALSCTVLLSQQDYDKESVFKQLLGLKDRHIQVNANVHIPIYGWINGLPGDLC